MLYRKVADVLKQHFIESGLAVSARIPTEMELAGSFGVSRGTVRHALKLLEEEGLIERVPGLGTFLRKEVTPPPPYGGSQRRIGVIIPRTQDQLSLNILIGAESVAKYRGYQVLFNHSDEKLEQEKEDIQRMRAIGVDGLIIFPVSNQNYNEVFAALVQEKFPFVLVDRYFPDLDCDYVVSDNIYGGYRATEHLILLGHQEIAFLYHPQADFQTTSVRDRFLGYRKALSEYHLNFQESWMVGIDDQVNEAEENPLQEYMDYLGRSDHLKAVFAINDVTAVSLISAAARMGIHVPGDLAVVGFDNVRMALQLQAPLTTINQERSEIGVRAANLLLSRIDGRGGPPEHIVIPTNLIVRDSCGARQRILKSEIRSQK